MEYIIIIAAIVIILGIIFLRRRGETPSDYVEPRFEHSGKQWVFNGILDIDHPPLNDTPFTDYEGDLQLMVKKGYRHLELEVEASSAKRPPLGLFKGAARIQDDDIIVCTGSQTIGRLPKGQTSLRQAIERQGGTAEAYGFLAEKDGKCFGEVCIHHG